MIDFKNVIADELKKVTNIESAGEYIEVPANKEMGDLSLPCFKLAKEMKKAPQIIANEINENLQLPTELFSKTEVVNGYLNFFINPTALIKTVFEEFESKKDGYGSCNIGEGKTVVIDYSSPNIAKPFHIGHLKTTVLGGALYNIYKFLGYKVIGVNHLGDYGTQFGKLIEGYKRWGNEYDLSTDAIDKLGDIYKRINDLCSEDESVLEQCRENFKLLESGDEYCTKLWKEFRDLSIDEFKKIYDLLGSKFDSWNGEAFYADKTSEVIDILENTGKLIESEGAKIIDLTDAGTAGSGEINMLYAIVAIGFVFQSEKILRRFFGFDQASTLENGSAIGGALAMATVHQLGKLNKIGGKGNKGKNGNGQGGEGKKNDRVRTADKGRSTRDLLAAQANGGQNDGQGNDRDEVMERYGAEGYGQNANGEYFNPYTDEYDSNYDPHNDSSYAQFNRNQNSSGNSAIDNPPVSGTIRTAQTEPEEPWNIKGWTEDDTRGAGEYIRDSWRNSRLRNNLNDMRENVANNRYVRAIGAAGAGAADRARRAGRAVGDFGRGVHDLAGRGVRLMPKPIRNTIRSASGAVGRAALGTAAVVGGRIKEKLPDAGRMIARGAAGAALGFTAGTLGVAAGLASGDDKNILSMGAAGLGAGAALGSGLAGNAMNADIKGSIDKMASDYTIKTKGIEAEEQRQNRIADQAAMKDKERQKLYKEKLELDSKADVKAALEDAQKYRESGITDDKIIIKAMNAKGFESERASDERIILAGLAQETGNDQKKIDQVQKRLEDRGFDNKQIKKYIDGIRDINKAI